MRIHPMRRTWIVAAALIAAAASATAVAVARAAGDAPPPAAPTAPDPACGGDPACFLPPARRTTWNPGLNAVGGIPHRTKVCATVKPGGADDSPAIQAALDRCPDDQVVQLVAGDYHFGKLGQIRFRRSHVTLRGTTDAAGRPTTRFLLDDDHEWPVLSFGEGGPNPDFLRQPVDLVGDGRKGATSVTVARDPGYRVGELVTLDQLRDPEQLWLNREHFGTEDAPTNRALFSRPDRFIGQVLEIKAIVGRTLRFSTPLHVDFPASRRPQLWRHSRYQGQDAIVTEPVTFSGAEDLYIEGGHYGGAADLTGVAYCWLRNIEVYRWLTNAVTFTRAFRCVLRDSFIHQTQNPTPGGGGYALAIDWHSSDNLVENDIHWAANKVLVMRAAGGGNVVAYSYMDDGFGAGYPTIPEIGLNASHFAGSHMELFEGNESWNFGGDAVWGTALWVTAFRNHLTGLRRNAPGVTESGARGRPVDFKRDAGGRRMVLLAGGHDFYSFIGNVLGYQGMPAPGGRWSYESTTPAGLVPAVWNIGVDGQTPPLGVTQAMCDRTRQRTIRHGNYDYVTGRTAWEPSLPGRALPPSLYLSAKPAFLGDAPWPVFDPDRDPRVGALPARKRFEAMIGR